MNTTTLSLHHQRLLGQVLVKGNPVLARTCAPVSAEELATPAFRDDCTRLCETLLAFRATHGYGRAIAAPQIGVTRRMIALNLKACSNYESVYQHALSRPSASDTAAFAALDLPGDCLVLINPEMIYQSKETRTVWDDCLSLPDMMVRVKRFAEIGVQWMDHHGQQHVWNPENIRFDLAELLQHEMDHLDGVLATDIVALLEKNDNGRYPSIVSRQEFEGRKTFFQSYVDYVI